MTNEEPNKDTWDAGSFDGDSLVRGYRKTSGYLPNYIDFEEVKLESGGQLKIQYTFEFIDGKLTDIKVEQLPEEEQDFTFIWCTVAGFTLIMLLMYYSLLVTTN